MGDDSEPAGLGPDQSNGPTGGGDDAPPALRVIGAFGGIRPMANKLNVAVSTVQGWKERGVIPKTRHDEIRAAAAAHGVALDEADLAASAEAPPEPQSDAGDEATTEPSEVSLAKDDRAEDDTPPTVAPAAAAAASQSSRGRSGWVPGFVLGALVFAIGAGGAVLTQDIWGDGAGTGGGDSDLADQFAALESRLATVEAEAGAAPPVDNLATAADLARLEGEIAALSGGADATADLADQLAELEVRLASLGDSASAGAEAASALGGLSGEVAAVSASVEEVRAAVEEIQARNAGQDALLWSAVGALRDALRYTGPFTAQLADVSRLAGDRAGFQEALADLKPLADRGVASLVELQRAFPAAARDIVAAGYGDGSDGVFGDILNRVSQVVSVRPVGAVEGDDPGAIVARAEGHLDQGDLAAALAELKGLTADASQAAEPWRQQAEERLAADAAITRLNGLLAGQLAAGG